MSTFEALCHSMTTLATGGFSTRDASIGEFNSPAIEWIISFFMLVAGMNFVLHYRVLSGRFRQVRQDGELRYFLWVVTGGVVLVSIALLLAGSPFEETLRQSVFQTLATRILGLVAFSAWLDRVVAYLPTLLAGGFIILAGLVISTLARDLTAAAVASARLAHAEVFARGVQAAILVMALVLGINQIGIDVTLLITLIAILAAAITGALALAFALGSRSFVSNLIGAHYLQQLYTPGQRAIIGEIEGEIIEMTPVGVVLATGRGRVTIPAKIFNEQPTTLLAEVRGDE
jgi:hypothetical protein